MVYMDIFICTLHLLRFQNIVLVPFMSRFGDKTDWGWWYPETVSFPVSPQVDVADDSQIQSALVLFLFARCIWLISITGFAW